MLDSRSPMLPVQGRLDGPIAGLRPSGAAASPGGSEEARRVKTLVLAGRGDEAREVFADLVATQQRRASRLALYLLRDATDADEAVQDTFVKVFTHITIRSSRSLRTSRRIAKTGRSTPGSTAS
jgi:hypothetical protein